MSLLSRLQVLHESFGLNLNCCTNIRISLVFQKYLTICAVASVAFINCIQPFFILSSYLKNVSPMKTNTVRRTKQYGEPCRWLSEAGPAPTAGRSFAQHQPSSTSPTASPPCSFRRCGRHCARNLQAPPSPTHTWI